MKTYLADPKSMPSVAPARSGVRGWQRWMPYASVAWSLLYGALGVYWALGGNGFPYLTQSGSDSMGPLLGRFGPVVAWVVVILAGFPAAALGAAMLRGVRGGLLRTAFIIAGILLGAALLLLMTGLDLLVKVGYLPMTIAGLLPGEKRQMVLAAWVQWETIHQLVCLTGGFLWLAATVVYARRSAGACLVCGRTADVESWTSPARARRWGRIAVIAALIAPLFYALTRYAWAVGLPLGMTPAAWREGQEAGRWLGGLGLATFVLVGAILMLGLVQRWGEVFPRWMLGLAGRGVPIALAVIPAAIAAVLLGVGGIGIWAGLDTMIANAQAAGANGGILWYELFFQVGPTLLFPLWGLALAVATLGYYYRRRGACRACGRGTPTN
jgi:hypothetical protein